MSQHAYSTRDTGLFINAELCAYLMKEQLKNRKTGFSIRFGGE